jgi:hypothetical protein
MIMIGATPDSTQPKILTLAHSQPRNFLRSTRQTPRYDSRGMRIEPAVSASHHENTAPLGLKLTIEHLWLGVPLFVLLWKCFLFPLPTLDFWWHLKIGEIIATTHSIPRVDSFSFTATGKLFVLQNWLAELLYYGVYSLGGLQLIVFFNACVLLGAYLPIYSLCREATSSLRTASVVTVLAVLGSICNTRPQVYSFLMFALFYWVLDRYRDRRKDLLWMLPCLMVLWINLHGAFPLGLGLIGLYVGAGFLQRLINPNRDAALTPAELRKLVLVLVLCIVATLANPEGYRVYDYVRTVMTDGGSQQFVAEWQPPRIDDISGVLLFFGPFLLTVIVLIYSRVKPDFIELTLFLAFAAFGLKSLRNGVWFSMIAYPILARYAPALDFRNLMAWLVRRGWMKDSVESDDGVMESRPANYRLNALFAVVGIILLSIQSPWIRPTLYKAPLIDPKTPVNAMNFIGEHKLAGNIFHPQTFGDYLIWRLWPEQKSFIDGRVHIFGVDFIRKYQAVFGDSHWEDLLATWNIRYLLLPKDPRDDDSQRLIHRAGDSEHWQKVYEDDLAILFEKR